MLIPNTLFRMGGAAVVLTNRASERPRAKYELQHVVRVHLGADDVAYECVFQHEDDRGTVGVELNRDLVKVAGKALQKNLTKMGPLVLPVSEQLKFAANWVARASLGPAKGPSPYVPDFKRAFDHFCLHAGGRGVIDGLSKQLGLPAEKAAPSYNSLYWYGNTSRQAKKGSRRRGGAAVGAVAGRGSGAWRRGVAEERGGPGRARASPHPAPSNNPLPLSPPSLSQCVCVVRPGLHRSGAGRAQGRRRVAGEEVGLEWARARRAGHGSGALHPPAPPFHRKRNPRP